MQNLQEELNTVIIWAYENKSLCARMLKVAETLRKNPDFCDVILKTDDGAVIYGHKVILASASSYFHAIFSNSEVKKDLDLVVIPQMDSTALQLLVQFIYSGKIAITEGNVKDLLPAAKLLQLKGVSEACRDFLQEYLQRQLGVLLPYYIKQKSNKWLVLIPITK